VARAAQRRPRVGGASGERVVVEISGKDRRARHPRTAFLEKLADHGVDTFTDTEGKLG